MTKLIKKIAIPMLSFFLPLTIMCCVLLAYDIYPASDKTILASDGFHQYVIFAQAIRDIFHGKSSIFYTFTSGLGLNFYALISYYLGSFLTPLYYFFDVNSMPDAIYLVTLLKIGFIGLSSFICFSKLYKRVDKWFVLILSCFYALMSFSISQLEINMWLDVFILFPIILLGLNRLINQCKVTLYYITLTLLFVENYYFGYMFAIFLVSYFPVVLAKIKGFKTKIKVLFRFVIISVLSGLSSSIMLLPTILDLQTHGEKLTKLTSWFTESSWYFDIFAKNFVGVYDTTKFGSIPTIYIGLPVFILSLFYFTLRKVRLRDKLIFIIPILFLIVSFYLEPLDLFWQGMHAPNMFLHRYSWAFSLLILLLAFETLGHLETITAKNFLFPFLFLGFGFSLTLVFHQEYDFIENINVILTFSFLIAYALIFICYKLKYLTKGLMFSFFIVFSLFEVFLNTYYQVGKLENEWVFPSRDGYEKYLQPIEHLVTQTENNNSDFYRMERVIGQTGNDSMKFGYNGISQFSSIRNRNSSHLLDRLGYKSTGTNLNLRYQNNTLLMDSLFGIKYNFSQGDLNKYGFSLESNDGAINLYQNKNALALGILSQNIYKDIDITVNTLDNQTAILNQLTGLKERFFYRNDYEIDRSFTELGNRLTVKSGETSELHLNMIASRSGQVYISMPDIKFTNEQSKTVEMIINQKKYTFTTDDAYSFFDMGYFEAGEQIDATIIFPNNKQVSLNKPNIYILDKESFERSISVVKANSVKAVTSSNQVNLTYQSQKDTSLIVTLPFDKGWSAKIDGKPVNINSFQNGLMKLSVPKGKHTVTMSFLPYGFKIGALFSLLGIVLFIFVRKYVILK